MPINEIPRQESNWEAICDNCGRKNGEFDSFEKSTKDAYKSGWLCLGKIWVCGGCRNVLREGIDNKRVMEKWGWRFVEIKYFDLDKSEAL